MAKFIIAAARSFGKLPLVFTGNSTNIIYVTASQPARSFHPRWQAQRPQAFRTHELLKKRQRKDGDRITGLRKTSPRLDSLNRESLNRQPIQRSRLTMPTI